MSPTLPSAFITNLSTTRPLYPVFESDLGIADVRMQEVEQLTVPARELRHLLDIHIHLGFLFGHDDLVFLEFGNVHGVRIVDTVDGGDRDLNLALVQLLLRGHLLVLANVLILGDYRRRELDRGFQHRGRGYGLRLADDVLLLDLLLDVLDVGQFDGRVDTAQIAADRGFDAGDQRRQQRYGRHESHDGQNTDDVPPRRGAAQVVGSVLLVHPLEDQFDPFGGVQFHIVVHNCVVLFRKFSGRGMTALCQVVVEQEGVAVGHVYQRVFADTANLHLVQHIDHVAV